MSGPAIVSNPEQQRALERFYFFEARLLDNRQYQQWLQLLSEDIRYLVPSRTNRQVDNHQRGEEAMLSVERELERGDGMGCPIREEGFIHLSLRVERAYKINSWSEQPPARTRRLVSNIELMAERGDVLDVISNFHLYYARPGSANYIYSGQRRDRLARSDDDAGFRLAEREVILDYATIELPTAGLIF